MWSCPSATDPDALMSASPPRFISREGQARRRRQTSSLGQGMPGISTHLGNMLAILAPLLCSGDGGLSPLRIIDNISRPHSWTVYVHRLWGIHLMEPWVMLPKGRDRGSQRPHGEEPRGLCSLHLLRTSSAPGSRLRTVGRGCRWVSARDPLLGLQSLPLQGSRQRGCCAQGPIGQRPRGCAAFPGARAGCFQR